jgi:hypothetical protein
MVEVLDRPGLHPGHARVEELSLDGTLLVLLALATALHQSPGVRHEGGRSEDGGSPLRLGRLPMLLNPRETPRIERHVDHLENATNHVGVLPQSGRAQDGIRKGLEVVGGDHRAGQVAEGFEKPSIRHDFQGGFIQAIQVGRLGQEILHDGPVLVEFPEVLVQRLLKPLLPKNGDRGEPLLLQLFAAPDRRRGHPAISGIRAGEGTGMRSISRGSNFVRPPA